MGPYAHLCIDVWRVGMLLLDLYILVPGFVVETTKVCIVVVVGVYFFLGEFWGSSRIRSLSSTFVSVHSNHLYRGVRHQHYHDSHQQFIPPIDKCRVVHCQLFSTWSPDPQFGWICGSKPGRQLDQNVNMNT